MKLKFNLLMKTMIPVIFKCLIIFLIIIETSNRLIGQVPVIFSPGVISAAAHDAAPAFTPDGKTVYFSRSNASASTILYSKFKLGKWSKPQIAPFSGRWNDMEPAMAPDGSFLIFISSRPVDEKLKAIDGFYNGKNQVGIGGNLWRVDRIGSECGEPIHLPAIINRSNTIYAPSIVKDGSVYFMEAIGQKGTFHLFRSQFVNGQYQPPQSLSFSNSGSTDVDPAVAPDESFMVFGSSRTPAKGIDLFIVFNKKGEWGEPVHMGTEINSSGSDAEPRLGVDRTTLYFSSDRVMPVAFPRTLFSGKQDMRRIDLWDNGNYNIWQVPLSLWLENNKHQFK